MWKYDPSLLYQLGYTRSLSHATFISFCESIWCFRPCSYMFRWTAVDKVNCQTPCENNLTLSTAEITEAQWLNTHQTFLNNKRMLN